MLRIESGGVITRIQESTDRCSKIVIVPKPSGKVRIYLDLMKLNERELYVMLAIDESLEKLAGAKFFSKLDANNVFWQVKLSEESAKLTTFITPLGRFYFNCLPYDLNYTSEYYMKMMAQATDNLEGMVCHVDDILVYMEQPKRAL